MLTFADTVIRPPDIEYDPETDTAAWIGQFVAVEVPYGMVEDMPERCYQAGIYARDGKGPEFFGIMVDTYAIEHIAPMFRGLEEGHLRSYAPKDVRYRHLVSLWDGVRDACGWDRPMLSVDITPDMVMNTRRRASHRVLASV